MFERDTLIALLHANFCPGNAVGVFACADPACQFRRELADALRAAERAGMARAAEIADTEADRWIELGYAPDSARVDLCRALAARIRATAAGAPGGEVRDEHA